jgi:hypothetical protein
VVKKPPAGISPKAASAAPFMPKAIISSKPNPRIHRFCELTTHGRIFECYSAASRC